MPKNLVIVESPAKAKTIEGYLGKDYSVKSSFGHIRDLPKSNDAIDIANGFKPTYVVSDDKKQVIADLKKSVKEAEIVWLATDDDREGEAISWHLQEALNLKTENTKRIVFREITKKAITKAIESPRGIDIDLVNAQQARRILDRLVGFELSPILWKKIKGGLSAGRVQSVAVRIVVERERDIEKFVPESSFKLVAEFLLDDGKKLVAELPKKLKDEQTAQEFLEKCVGAIYSIKKLEKKPGKKSPAPPFTTSTLQQEASRKLRYSVSRTMSLAQKLYEAGKITYMRTDSTNLSDDAIQAAKSSIENSFGANYFKQRKYKTKSATAQEAHEAIRPTSFDVQNAGANRDEQKLYELIWKRAIASQMADAQLERTTATVEIDPVEYNKTANPAVEMPFLTAKGEVITFDGFLKVYIESSDNEDDEEENALTKGMLPPLKVGQVLNLDFMNAIERFTKHPPRYTEASLVKKLEEMGIGRPSTYAPTISTIQKRGYIEKAEREGKARAYQFFTLKADQINKQTKTEITGAEKGKMFPTDVGILVNDFLIQHFDNIMDYSFTANVEKQFDEISQGRKEWVKMIEGFYGGFHEKVEVTADVDASTLGKQRLLGEHPENGKEVYAMFGRYGAYVQVGDNDDEDKQRSSLRKNQRLETITLEEALELFKLPREVGDFEGSPMQVNVGRYGPYVRHDGKFVSLAKEDDPYTVSAERAIELILAKRKADAEKFIKSFDENPEVQVLNGRYGPYIKVGKKNVKIPKGKDPKELTLEECLELAEKTPEKKGRGGAKKTASTTKKAPAAKKKAAPKKKATKTTAKKKTTASKKKDA
ncbi:MAG TPA: type I DNA topoisomerase [Microscillaceae bacterium]|nr:type I DNA topoisomerase [Microscillaceae bacterium]